MSRPRGKAPRDRSRSTRNRRLGLYPVCAECAKRGIVRATQIIDHKVPLAAGGPDTDENCQGLCLVCDAIKTANEDMGHSGASNHPDWLKPSAASLTIVCGPPYAGKHSYVHERAGGDDLVISLDQIMEALVPGYRPWSGKDDPSKIDRAIRIRNQLLGTLQRAEGQRAWFIVGAASPMERTWWRDQLGGELVLLDPPVEEVLQAARESGARYAEVGVRQWYSNRAMHWRPRAKRLRKRGSDADGYPLED